MMKTLQLQMHYMPDNQGVLVFRNNGKPYRIEGLHKALHFVANMKQLSMAIDTGASQDCFYKLRTNIEEWIFNCRFIKSMDALELWLEKYSLNRQLKTLFSWQGTAIDFRKVVFKFMDRLPRYRFCCWF